MNWLDNTRNRADAIRQRVYARRPLPVCDINYQVTFDITDFGIRPDTAENALPALRQALATAQASGKASRVCLAPGRYDLYPEFQGAGHCLKLIGARDLLFEGSWAKLVIHNPLAGWLRLEKCRNVLLQHFEVDYDPLPFTQGTVQDVHPTEGSFDLLVDAGYSQFDEPHWALLEPNMNWMDCSSWGMLKDRNVPGRLKSTAPSAIFAHRFVRLDDRLWRVVVAPSEAVSYFEPGDRYVHLSRPESDRGSFIRFMGCEGLSFIGMHTYASPSWCYSGWDNSHLGFIGCRVELKEGRWHTLDSDGINTSGARVGPWIENCSFEAGADDAMVSGVGELVLKRVVDYSTLELAPFTPLTLRPGDPVLFYNPRNGLPLGRIVVDAVDYDQAVAHFSEHVPQLVISTHRALCDQLYNLACLNNNLVIRANTVRNNRRWPVWLYTPAMDGALIENNTFEGCDSTAIKVFQQVDWDVPKAINDEYAAIPESELPQGVGEGYGLGHVLIANNRIETCGFNTQHAAIHITHPRLGYRPSPWPMLEEMLVVGNTIINWGGKYALDIANTRHALVADNAITQNNNPYPHQPLGYLRIAYSHETQVLGNRLSDTQDLPLISPGPFCSGLEAEHNQVE